MRLMTRFHPRIPTRTPKSTCRTAILPYRLICRFPSPRCVYHQLWAEIEVYFLFEPCLLAYTMFFFLDPCLAYIVSGYHRSWCLTVIREIMAKNYSILSQRQYTFRRFKALKHLIAYDTRWTFDEIIWEWDQQGFIFSFITHSKSLGLCMLLNLLFSLSRLVYREKGGGKADWSMLAAFKKWCNQGVTWPDLSLGKKRRGT